ncbi:ring-h2 finger protein atl79 [Quercus suber]|uniref:RING-type E3 ubiquitin transferase n=1 Tax=Quercus suber TaxID=58331 RepID=A0AAW0KXN2_QUESU
MISHLMITSQSHHPYSNSRDFEANVATVLIVLLCTLICALVLNSAIRCFLRGGGGGNNHQQPLPQNQQEVQHDEPKSTLEKEAADTSEPGVFDRDEAG